MQTITKKNMALIVFGTTLALCHSAWAESDKQLQEKTLKAREMQHMLGSDHSLHSMEQDDPTMGFHGVFYGYLPCNLPDCDGFKMTLSLKQKDNYLLVMQYARASSRETYDKGKYVWDDKTHTVKLTSKKDGSVRLFTIKDEGTLVHLNNDGSPMGKVSDYELARSDKGKTREVHIH